MSDYELASRLSYFLWSSMPDDELLRLARTEDAAQAGGSEGAGAADAEGSEVECAGSEFRRAVAGVPGAGIGASGSEPVSEISTTICAMSERTETEMFFEHIMREDRSVLDFLERQVYVPQREAGRVLWHPRSERAGVPPGGSDGHAARRRSHAGQRADRDFVLHPNLGGAARQMGAGESAERACAAASAERSAARRGQGGDGEFAAPVRWSSIGRIRSALRAIRGWTRLGSAWRISTRSASGALRTASSDIDASGQLTNGQKFSGPAELTDVLAKQPQAFAGAITEKMLTYALGRGLESYDRPTVKAIVANLGQNDYRFSSLVLGIVNSLPFQERTAPGKTGQPKTLQASTGAKNVSHP